MKSIAQIDPVFHQVPAFSFAVLQLFFVAPVAATGATDRVSNTSKHHPRACAESGEPWPQRIEFAGPRAFRDRDPLREAPANSRPQRVALDE